MNRKHVMAVIAGFSLAGLITSCSSDDTDKVKDSVQDVKNNLKDGAAAVSNAVDGVAGELDRSRATDSNGNEADIAVNKAVWDTSVPDSANYKKLDVDVSVSAKKGQFEVGAFNFIVNDKNGKTIKGYIDPKGEGVLKRTTVNNGDDSKVSGVVSFNVPKDFTPEFVNFYFDKNATGAADAKETHAKSKIKKVD